MISCSAKPSNISLNSVLYSCSLRRWAVMSRLRERTDGICPCASLSGISRQLWIAGPFILSKAYSVSKGSPLSNTLLIASSQKRHWASGKPNSRWVLPMNCAAWRSTTLQTFSETNRCRPSRSKRITTSGSPVTSARSFCSLSCSARSFCLISVMSCAIDSSCCWPPMLINWP